MSIVLRDRGARARRSDRTDILLVEDDPDNAYLTALLLELIGYSVTAVPDGSAALKVAVAERPRVILLDIRMPRMDGYELARRLRALPGGQLFTLIALTGCGFPHEVQQALDSGMDAHLLKPVALATLQERLARFLPAAH